MSLFIGIVIGVMMGIGASALLVALRETWVEDEPEGNLADYITGVTPVETPFMSEIERHRQKHLAAGGVYGADGLRRSDTERRYPGVTGGDPDRQV